MGIITWIIVGFVAGLIARAIMPGKQAMGIIATTGLGVVGSLLGGFVGHLIWGHGEAHAFSPGGLGLSILGALVVLFIFMRLKKPARTSG